MKTNKLYKLLFIVIPFILICQMFQMTKSFSAKSTWDCLVCFRCFKGLKPYLVEMLCSVLSFCQIIVNSILKLWIYTVWTVNVQLSKKKKKKINVIIGFGAIQACVWTWSLDSLYLFRVCYLFLKLLFIHFKRASFPKKSTSLSALREIIPSS